MRTLFLVPGHCSFVRCDGYVRVGVSVISLCTLACSLIMLLVECGSCACSLHLAGAAWQSVRRSVIPSLGLECSWLVSRTGLTRDPYGTRSHEYDSTVYCIFPHVKGINLTVKSDLIILFYWLLLSKVFFLLRISFGVCITSVRYGKQTAKC